MFLIRLFKLFTGKAPISARILPPGSVAAFTPKAQQVVIVIDLEEV